MKRSLSFFLIHYYRARGIRIGTTLRMERGVEIRRGYRDGSKGHVSIGNDCHLESGAILDAYGGKIRLTNRVFVGPYVVMYGHGGIEIGPQTLVSMHCRILSSNHTIPPCDRLIRDQPDVLKPTKIGSDVWLGAGVTVLGHVNIGDGCVVGAGAVVTHDLPPYSIAMGVPARVTGNRAGA